MADAATLSVLLRVDDKATAQLKKFGRQMTIAGGIAVAAFGFAIKGAQNFETGMREVNTLIEGSEKQLADMSLQVRKLSTDFGIDAVDATKALYQAISAGQKPAEAIQFLEVAARLAIGGVTDLQTSVDGLTTVVNAFGLGSAGAERAADIMFATVDAGKTNIAELSASLFQAAPVANAIGVSFEELGAAAATITLSGTTSKIAMTGLRAIMNSMLRPTATMSTALEAMGFQSGLAAVEQLGLIGTLEGVRNQLGNNISLFAEAIGTIEAITPATQLTGQNFKVFEGILKGVEGSTGASTRAFQEMEKSSARSSAKMAAAFGEVRIAIGTALLPAFTSIIKAVTPLLLSFAEFAKEHEKLIKFAAAAAIGLLALGVALTVVGFALSPLIAGFGLAAGGIGLFMKGVKLLTTAQLRQGVVAAIAWAATFAPIGIGIIAVGAVIAAFLLFKDKMIAVFNIVGRVFGEYVDLQLTGFRLIISALNKIPGVAIPQIMDFGDAWSDLGNVMSSGIESAKGAIDGLLSKVTGFNFGVSAATDAAGEFAAKLPLIAAGLGLVAEFTGPVTTAIAAQGDAVVTAHDKLKDYILSLRGMTAGALDAFPAIATAAMESGRSVIDIMNESRAVFQLAAQQTQVGAMMMIDAYNDIETAIISYRNALLSIAGMDPNAEAAIINQAFRDVLEKAGKGELIGLTSIDVEHRFAVKNPFAGAASGEHGGIVPGTRGQAVPIIAHAQELIIPAGQRAGGTVNNFTFNGDFIGTGGEQGLVDLINRVVVDTALGGGYRDVFAPA